MVNVQRELSEATRDFQYEAYKIVRSYRFMPVCEVVKDSLVEELSELASVLYYDVGSYTKSTMTVNVTLYEDYRTICQLILDKNQLHVNIEIHPGLISGEV